MILIDSQKVFEHAITNQNVETVESLLLCSDGLNDLIKTYCKNNNFNKLLEISQSFKSKGLIRSIEMIVEKYKHYSNKKETKEEQKKIILTHQANKANNEKTHLNVRSVPIKALDPTNIQQSYKKLI